MNRIIVIGALLLNLAARATGAACDPSDPKFVCGLTNAEDLVRLSGTPWIVASHLDWALLDTGVRFGSSGPIEAIRIDTREVHRLYPTPKSQVDWDRRTYPDCTGPPKSLASHGLNIRSLGPAKYRVYIANHGGRESVEIIDVSVRADRLLTTWRGCILAPAGLTPNALVPLPGDALALAGGSVAVWHPARGWRKVAGVEGFANGIEASPDKQWLFVNVQDKGLVIRVPVSGGAVQRVFKGEFQPDNLRWGEDGYLYSAGHFTHEDDRWKECVKAQPKICDIGFVVAQIDPRTLTGKEILRRDGAKGVFGVATTALQIGNDFWVGSAWADRVMIVTLPQRR